GRVQPDVAVVDVRMPGGGTEAIRGILTAAPGCGVVALSAYEERSTVLEMLLAGASGYVVKGAPAAEVVEAVRRTARKQVSVSVEMMSGVIEELVHGISELGRTQEILGRNEERFRALLDSAPDAVVIADERGRIVLVNNQTEKMFGQPRSVVVGRPVESLLPGRYREAHERHRSEYLRNPITRPMGVGLRLAGLRADGSEFPLDISLSSLQTSEGVLVTAFVRDVTERVRAEKELHGLEELVHGQEERRDLMAHLVRAQEDERARIAADIHDDSLQIMTASAMRLEMLRDELTDPTHIAL